MECIIINILVFCPYIEQKQSESRIHKLEESVTCSLCKGIFKDPKVLSCHHSFCLACLERVHETEAGQCTKIIKISPLINFGVINDA